MIYTVPSFNSLEMFFRDFCSGFSLRYVNAEWAGCYLKMKWFSSIRLEFEQVQDDNPTSSRIATAVAVASVLIQISNTFPSPSAAGNQQFIVPVCCLLYTIVGSFLVYHNRVCLQWYIQFISYSTVKWKTTLYFMKMAFFMFLRIRVEHFEVLRNVNEIGGNKKIKYSPARFIYYVLVLIWGYD